MNMVWDWIHEDGAEREKVLEELCPGWSILSSKTTSEQALMVAFDALVAERRSDSFADDARIVRDYLEWQEAIHGGAASEETHKRLVGEQRLMPTRDEALDAARRIEEAVGE